ncbi:MAG: hypothetical protein IPK22_26810 [Verrucomicrobiaceae bacterium]|nr:hypothetical protein [Verrucomicrobiaceae bacterium]
MNQEQSQEAQLFAFLIQALREQKEMTSSTAFEAVHPRMAAQGFQMSEAGRLSIFAFLQHLKQTGYVVIEKRPAAVSTEFFYLATDRLLAGDPPEPPSLRAKRGCLPAIILTLSLVIATLAFVRLHA